MIRMSVPCLLFLFCHAIAGMVFAQDFPLKACTEVLREPLSAGSPDCLLFKSGTPDTGNAELGRFRQALGEPAHMRLGVALSGGGSKAAPFAMGVLAGLSDTGLLDKVDAVSTVSGGSYAAYFYFNRLVARYKMRESGKEVPADYVQSQFRDCVYPYQSLQMQDGRKLNLCDGLRDPVSPFSNIHQAFVRCRQDVMEPMNCSASAKRPDSSDPGAVLGLLAVTAASLPFHHFANTFLDLGVNMSPSRAAYQAGLGSAYGLIPATPDAIPSAHAERPDLASPAPKPEYFANATMAGGFVQPVPYTIEDLQAAYRNARGTAGDHVPLWIINAHAARSRSLWGWLTWDWLDLDFDRDIFEFTPFYTGSGRYGYWNKPMRGIDLLGATAASAAFLDANNAHNRRFPRFGLAALQHVSNTDWGTDIRNWNVGPERLARRPLLPVPLYWVDSWVSTAGKNGDEAERTASPFIRLLDGGSGDDLGAYSLISRGVENIIIADSAQDREGKMNNVCVLHRQLQKRGLHLHFPALDGFDGHCGTLDGIHVRDEKGYPVRDWPYPIIAGCISSDADNKECDSGKGIRHRIFLVKPALDLNGFLDRQARSIAQRQGVACTAEGDPDRGELPCETAGFIIDNIASARRCVGFPQHTTVLATAYSSAALYGAYRELARHYVRSLGGDAAALGWKFEDLLAQQREQKIHLAANEDCEEFEGTMTYR